MAHQEHHRHHHIHNSNTIFWWPSSSLRLFWNIQVKFSISIYYYWAILFCCCFCCCPSSIFAQIFNPLDKHIIHYETLNYDTKPHLLALHRSRRFAQYHTHHADNPTYQIEFNSHGRNFQLRLKRDIESVFHQNLIIEDSDGRPLSLNLDHLVTGHLNNQPNSLVYGSIRDGIFEGKIHSTIPDEDILYVERAHKYFKPDPIDVYLLDNQTQTTKYNFYDLIKSVTLSKTSSLAPQSSSSSLPILPFHSVIYSSKHVRDPFRHRRSPIDGACGANEKVREWMDSVAMSATTSIDDDDNDNNHNRQNYSTNHNLKNNFGNNSTDPNVAPSTPPLLSRSKRASNYDHHNNYNRRFEAQGRISYNRPPPPQQPSTPYLPSKRACSLYIQTDTFLWDHVKKQEVDKSDMKVREEIASLVAQHIKAVNHIYETSVFKNIMGLKFIVQRLRINDSSACEGKKREFNQFCSPNIDVSNFLNLNSQFNHNDFCLAYIFTYRDFSGGTLGLAWVASTSGASGGICEKYKTFTENINGKQVQTKRSLNTGIITFVNYNSRVPPKVSELTLAHEIGHNFGSPHDYPAECRPGGPLGNYIMYSSATSGERQNNNKFSHCSITNISTVLNAVFNNEGKENCFQEDNGPFCGNKIVEEGEECDCGYDSRECNEDCCYPRNVDEFKQQDPDAQPCRRRPGADCSPSQGPCCTERCSFEGKNKQCRDDGECTYKSFCNGQRAHCPLPPAKPNKTECNMGTQVCWRGSCTGSICQKYDLEECFLTAKRGAKPDEMCEVACQQRNQPETCRRTSEISIMKNISGMKLRPGSPCNDFQGYCDVFQRCRPVDAEGPLARLKNLLFNKKTLISIKQWVTTYWWACTLMLFAGVLFMACFIKCCAVHTPSSNPKRKKALRITDTLRRPADTLRRKSRSTQAASSSAASSSGGHRRDRERSRERSNNNHGRSAGHNNRTSASAHNSNSQQQQQQSHLQQIPPSNHQSQSSSHNVMASHQTPSSSGSAVAAASSSGSSINPANIIHPSAYPPTLVVNLPPAKDLLTPHEPPPPYPGLTRPSAPPIPIPIPGAPPPIPGAPSHGYGEGRGHYNRHTNGPNSNSSSGGGGSSSGGNASKSSKSSGKKDESKNHRR